jgi:hypothetical protein
MGARMDLSVTLSPEEGNGALTVKYDHDAAETAAAVDFVAGGPGRLFSCSLDEAEEFAALLSDFVQHHRPTDPEDGDES